MVSLLCASPSLTVSVMITVPFASACGRMFNVPVPSPLFVMVTSSGETSPVFALLAIKIRLDALVS